MLFGLSIPPFTEADHVVAMAADAERAGWDGVFLWDHLRWNGRVDTHDPWVLLGAIARTTTRVRLGTMITPLSRRRPQVVAKQVITLDHLSRGRAVLGVGLGEPPDNDFAAFGDEADPVARAGLLDESLHVLAGLLGEGTVDHDGDRLHVHASVRPLPVQRPRVPIWVAGVAPHRRPLERARRWDGFIPIAWPFLSPDELAAYVGRVPRPGWEVVAQAAPDVPADAYAEAGATWLITSVPAGEPGWVDELAEHAAAGPPRG